MKRSEINKALKELETTCEKYHCYMPPSAISPPSSGRASVINMTGVRQCMLGWDITDYSKGDFDKMVFSLISIRNGNHAMTDKYPAAK